MHVVMVGLMGSGKTTVGALIAKTLHRPLIDSDQVIEAGEGRTTAEIAAADGIAHLHAIEHRTLLDALSGTEPAVICAAASVVDEDTCVAALLAAYVVWLDIDPGVLAARIDGPDHRRRLDDPVTELTRLRTMRHGGFAAVADFVVTEVTDPARVAATVSERLTGR